MAKANNTKKALLSSAFALLICVAMLIGTTFAWFTDTASTAVNKIKSGTLKVDIVKEDGETSLKGASMSFVNVDESDDILWEPGVTFKTPAFKIKSTGSLALKYKLALNGVNGDSMLLDVIKFSVVKADGTEIDLDTFEGHLKPGDELSEKLYIKGHMDEAAGNDYQGKELTGLGITVVAAQDTVESDSYRNTYDENATYDALITKGAGKDAVGSGDAETKNTFEEAVTVDAENLIINLADDVVYDLNGYTLPMGGESTKTITINGNGHTVTFNKLNSDCSSVMFSGNVVKFTINNATITSSGNDQSGTWNVRDIVFTTNVELNNVISNRGIALARGKKSVLKGITINETDCPGDVYAMWIEAGATVEIDGLTVNAKSNTGKSNRGIAIKDQFITDPELTELSIKNATFSTDKKAAILVTSKGGAKITLENIDITNVAADTDNAVWVDKGVNNISAVTVTGGTAIVEP